jgi:hypothetical protein
LYQRAFNFRTQQFKQQRQRRLVCKYFHLLAHGLNLHLVILCWLKFLALAVAAEAARLLVTGTLQAVPVAVAAAITYFFLERLILAQLSQ